LKKPALKVKDKKTESQKKKLLKINIKSKKIEKPKSKAVCKVLPTGERFKCPYCPVTFAKAQALGGHTSKAHPG
jgi:hypothetical protein